ncbi:preprotein translocase subunit YajC [Aporhodopirellula aestuarii]|uniref:Sec translocon accessory complex subunit YajC n=1 Tax=Aporhodopirellula aestuarii TaxID=2950107 RepID=A0ABT0UBN1_9BACT|nr:preprotein translocase subunit YajC [Aporhodopirellula aestuarii]MCM2374266.1 preprotein translocase subunit YajC [Aporhodopirellula aestuarii]
MPGYPPLLFFLDPSFLDLFAMLPSLDRVVDGFSWILLIGQEVGAGDPAAGPPSPLQLFFSSPLPLIAGLGMIWYLTWFLPEKRKRQDEATLLASLMKNDRVITIGGLHGTVVSAPADSDVVTLKIDEAGTTRVKVNRSAISAISVHAKGKSLDKDGRPSKIPGGESPSKNASDEDSSD